MEDAQGASGALPPFIIKTYEMVEDPSTNHIVSWSSNNKSFIVWDQAVFARDLLPRFFKHSNFSSFIRQLNTYGFRKIDPEQWEFANEDFIRGQPHLLRNIHRRKPVHSHSSQNLHGNPNPLTESERLNYKDEIESLKQERKSLLNESQILGQEEKEIGSQMQHLRERLHLMEKAQKNLVDYLARILQKPGLALTLVPHIENHERKRRLPRLDYFHDEYSNLDEENGVHLRRGHPNTYLLTPEIELLERLESSLGFWENLMVEQVGTQHCSAMDLEESTSCAGSTAISYTQLDVDVPSNSPKIDMNSEPSPIIAAAAAPLPSEASVSNAHEASAAPPAVKPGVNDGFWQQFLTENPGSTDTQEVQSERKDATSSDKDGKTIRYGEFTWTMRRMGNNISEQMRQLTSAGRS